MKKLLLTSQFVLLAVLIFAQTPQAFKYQAVVRNNLGEIIQNQPVGIRISIHNGSAGGTIPYQEAFMETTNQYGLVNLEIGNGTPTIGTFTGIDWKDNTKFLEVEFDSDGGSNYISMGTSQLLSVPYALYSENTANTNDADADPTNELNTTVSLNGTDLKVTDAGGTISTNLNGLVDDADANPTNEIQTISKAGNTVTISDGGGSFVDETTDADADPTNELNTSVSLDGTDLKVTDAGGTISTNLNSLVDDADANPANELQALSIDGSDLSISDGNTVTLPSNPGDNLGNHAATQNIQLNGNWLSNDGDEDYEGLFIDDDGDVGIGPVWDPLKLSVWDTYFSSNNNIENVIEIARGTIMVPEPGIGTGLSFRTQIIGGGYIEAGRVSSVMENGYSVRCIKD